jgi:hypothetical protein
MIDIGIENTPSPQGTGTVLAIPGRITKVLPDGPCMRCQGIIDDAKLQAERGEKLPGTPAPPRSPIPQWSPSTALSPPPPPPRSFNSSPGSPVTATRTVTG